MHNRIQKILYIPFEHPDPQPPLIELEDYILMIFTTMAMAKMPLENLEALGFINSLIDGTIWKDKLREYQETLPNITEESKDLYGYSAY